MTLPTISSRYGELLLKNFSWAHRKSSFCQERNLNQYENKNMWVYSQLLWPVIPHWTINVCKVNAVLHKKHFHSLLLNAPNLGIQCIAECYCCIHKNPRSTKTTIQETELISTVPLRSTDKAGNSLWKINISSVLKVDRPHELRKFQVQRWLSTALFGHCRFYSEENRGPNGRR